MQGVSFIIKALNEEKYIEAAILSALEEVKKVGGEVILADSGSTDHTVEIAMRFPITIIQLDDSNEGSCGIGPQLGFIEAKGDYLFLLDGDMEVVLGFTETALKEFESNPKLAGVGGYIEDAGELNSEFRLRSQIASRANNKGVVSHLGGGGLFRTSAIISIGYFTNRNLHAFEELELGIRLNHAGWQTVRLSLTSTLHHPHQSGGYVLLMARWRSKRWMGAGEFIRASIGKGYFIKVLPKFQFLYVTLLWLITCFFTVFSSIHCLAKIQIVAIILLFPFAVMSLRYRDFGSGIYCVVSWVFSLVGAIIGFFTSQVDPTGPIHHKIIKQGDWIQSETGGNE